MPNTSFNDLERRLKLADQYRKKLSAQNKVRESRLTKEQYDFIRALKSNDALLNNKIYLALYKAVNSRHEMDAVFGSAINDHHKDIICYFAKHIHEYPYAISYYRRSFRAVSFDAYMPLLRSMVLSFLYDSILDEPLCKILNGEISEEIQAYLNPYGWGSVSGNAYNSWQIAYALDMRESDIEEAIRRILLEENGSGNLTTELIRGVVRSHREDLHDVLGKLLLAARLQEGLRQVICENADCGTPEAFKTILNVIIENNLIRFSSVKRAADVWLGIFSDDVRSIERINAKNIGLIQDCLENKELRYEYIKTEDSMKIYVALWSFGFENAESAVEQVRKISREGTHHQLLTAGYFTMNLDEPHIENKIAKSVIYEHKNEKDILAVWLPCFMPGLIHSQIRDYVNKNEKLNVQQWFIDKAEITKFYDLMWELYDNADTKVKKFSPCVFPWHEAEFSKARIAEYICIIACMSEETDKIDRACSLIKECGADSRYIYLSALLKTPVTDIQRRTALMAVADKESYTRESAVKIVDKMKLKSDEYSIIEEHLRFKSGDIRRASMKILMRQNDNELRECISRLLENKSQEVRCAALDMLAQLQKDAKRTAFAEFIPKLEDMRGKADISPAESVLIDTILPKRNNDNDEISKLFTDDDRYVPDAFDEEFIKTSAEVFARYFPDSKLPDMISGSKTKKSVMKRITEAVSNKGGNSCAEAGNDIRSLSKLIDKHKEDMFAGRNGEEVLLANAENQLYYQKETGFPLEELWNTWQKDNGITNERLMRALVLSYAYHKKDRFVIASEPFVKELYGNGFADHVVTPYKRHIINILKYLSSKIPISERKMLAFAIAVWFVKFVPDDKVMLPFDTDVKDRNMLHLLSHSQICLLYNFLHCHNNDSLRVFFPAAAALSEKCIEAYRKFKSKEKQVEQSYPWYIYRNDSVRRLIYSYNNPIAPNELIGVNEYIIAAYRGIITMRQLYHFLFNKYNISSALGIISSATWIYRDNEIKNAARDSKSSWSYHREARIVEALLGKRDEWDDDDKALLSFVADIYDTVIPVVLASELKRGDSKTEYSRAVKDIRRIYGSYYFTEILNVMNGITLERSGYYDTSDRRASLSHLLSVCVPYENDNASTLGSAVQGKKISKKRLIEAALYSPDWIPIVGEYLNIPSFESVCYYFIAHMNEYFDNKRRAVIARYTPLTEEELNIGAFDIDWFKTAYDSIDHKEFDLIYDAAKYISDGSKHSRARKYADAVLGKFSVEQTEETISDKRNKDMLMAYSLIPIQNEDDICRRYMYIQKFRKESRQFGSQRSASEAKASEIALSNLALNAGYSDTMRLTLRMETKMIDDKREMFNENVIDGVAFKLEVGSDGKSDIMISKDGKMLKSVPAKFKKNSDVMALSDMKKKLNEQYRRTKAMLEDAMENMTEFTAGEICELASHPVVFPMISKLVFVSGDICGFPTGTGFADAEGNEHVLSRDEKVVIAHPYTLYKNGSWQNYQRYLFDNKIVQPFRQVFREVYVKTPEELERVNSLRYAGNQIQPAKTAAVLKSRRWVADIENGLQKVYYKADIVAELYAIADWFSPSEIEAPNLEYVVFSNRKTGAAIKIKDIPDIIFSEVMRDTDLAVSVAHAGGVDPEASHSTIEMREALISFMLPMFRIQNVKIEKKHTIINGKLADYSIHLGSGIVHQIGGTMIPVLPIHSQHRGKIFLPFADDDPKTAEIVSKILLFAEDSKIKDPNILSCISVMQ